MSSAFRWGRIADAVRRARRRARQLLGKEPRFVPSKSCEIIPCGDAVGWHFCPAGLSPDSVIYSFGIGQDIEFETQLIAKYQAVVHAFDPTPRSLAWLDSHPYPDKFIPHTLGLAAFDGTAVFFPPTNPQFVSYSVVQREGTSRSGTPAPVLRLESIMKRLGHTRIDLLKMDIEGSEYAVVEDILRTQIPVGQLLIEFHHRWPEIGRRKTEAAVISLNQSGFEIFFISPNGAEYGFVSNN